jgi:DNA primase
MPFFSEETLQAVRAIPLYEIVRSHVDLSRSGRNWRGLSPFSQEKTPSFFVLPEKNFFKCHSSGLAGDGIRFLQETEKLTFPEAVEALAERFAIPLRYADGAGPDPARRSLRQALLDIHEYAMDYFHQAFLADNPAAAQVRDYWVAERGFTLELARAFRIGFSPPDGRELLQRLEGKGFAREALAASGLFHASRSPDDPGRWFPVFRGRLMVPIRDLQGQVVAFTARQLEQTPRDHDSWKAKYINSPETPVFSKGQLLFNLDRARDAVRSAGRILMVEGQLDALRCWDCGLQSVVAPQGTSVTGEQLGLVKRYTDRLDLLLDSDSAGQGAALRLLPMAFKNRLQVTVIRLPGDADPDDFLRARGASGLQCLEHQSAIGFAAGFLLGGDNPSPEDRAKALNGIFELIEACPSEVVREGYLAEAIERIGVSPEAAHADYQRFTRRRTRSPAGSESPPPTNHGTNPSRTLTNLESDLVWAVSQDAAWAEPLAQVIDHQWITTNTCEGKILSRILAQATVDHLQGKDDLLFLLETDEERDCFHRLFADDRPHTDMQVFLNQTIAALARRFCRDRVSALGQRISEAAGSPDRLPEVRQLITEKNEWLQHLANGPFPEVFPPVPLD